jgi:methylmalonyl-CoA mutase cobalamin-binding subunit
MPPKDAVALEQEHGMEKVFLPDTPMQTIIDNITARVNLSASD